MNNQRIHGFLDPQARRRLHAAFPQRPCHSQHSGEHANCLLLLRCQPPETLMLHFRHRAAMVAHHISQKFPLLVLPSDRRRHVPQKIPRGLLRRIGVKPSPGAMNLSRSPHDFTQLPLSKQRRRVYAAQPVIQPHRQSRNLCDPRGIPKQRPSRRANPGHRRRLESAPLRQPLSTLAPGSCSRESAADKPRGALAVRIEFVPPMPRAPLPIPRRPPVRLSPTAHPNRAHLRASLESASDCRPTSHNVPARGSRPYSGIFSLQFAACASAHAYRYATPEHATLLLLRTAPVRGTPPQVHPKVLPARAATRSARASARSCDRTSRPPSEPPGATPPLSSRARRATVAGCLPAPFQVFSPNPPGSVCRATLQAGGTTFSPACASPATNGPDQPLPSPRPRTCTAGAPHAGHAPRPDPARCTRGPTPSERVPSNTTTRGARGASPLRCWK